MLNGRRFFLRSREGGTYDANDVRNSGVSEFEAWLSSSGLPSDTVVHSEFGGVRGLKLAGGKNYKKGSTVMELSSGMTLSSSSSSSSSLPRRWDVTLALELLRNVLLGRESNVWGYCSLLTDGRYGTKRYEQGGGETRVGGPLKDVPDVFNGLQVPQWCSPSSLRHWGATEREALVASWGVRGEKAVSMSNAQLKNWVSIADKPRTLPAANDEPEFSSIQELENALSGSENKNKILWFVWAMEAVHSRAFVGIPTKASAVASQLKGVGLQGLGALIAIAGATSFSGITSNAIEGVGGAVFIVGAVLTASSALEGTEKDEKEGVMLPWIDSANHAKGEGSSIFFDPLRQKFELTYDRDVAGDGGGEQQQGQLFISYGKRTEEDWLVNFGICEGLECNKAAGEEDYRRRIIDFGGGRQESVGAQR